MASKYMGAKMLKKQIDKEQNLKARAGKGKIVHANKGEYLAKRTNRLDTEFDSDAEQHDFKEGATSENPLFDAAYEMFQKSEVYMMTTRE